MYSYNSGHPVLILCNALCYGVSDSKRGNLKPSALTACPAGYLLQSSASHLTCFMLSASLKEAVIQTTDRSSQSSFRHLARHLVSLAPGGAHRVHRPSLPRGRGTARKSRRRAPTPYFPCPAAQRAGRPAGRAARSARRAPLHLRDRLGPERP